MYLQKRWAHIQSMLRAMPRFLRVVWVAVFCVLFLSLWLLGVVPEPLQIHTDARAEEGEAQSLNHTNDEPLKIVIDRIGVDAPIGNPQSRDIDVLNNALEEGVVHYPGSGDLEDTTNMFLFGHNSQASYIGPASHSAFRGIETLQEGEIIRVQSEGAEYQYAVTSVSLVNADEAWVKLEEGEKKLTLSTCNVFGKKQERFVVEARFLSAVALPQEHES